MARSLFSDNAARSLFFESGTGKGMEKKNERPTSFLARCHPSSSYTGEIARGRPAEGRPVDFLRLTAPPVNGQSHESWPYFKVASSRQRTLLRRRLTSTRVPKRRRAKTREKKGSKSVFIHSPRGSEG